jgi:aspartate/methionine/tyrosine aminotransferase
VFADYELEAGARARSARVVLRDDVLSFSLGGFSKTIGLPQVKLGWIAVAGPDARVQQALERLELICDTYLSVSTPVQVAAAELFDRGADVRAQIARRIAANYQQLRSAATSSTRSASTCLPSDGGWYGVLQVPSIEPEEDLVVRLVDVFGVVAHPGYFFDFPRESFLVVSLLPPLHDFLEGVTRVLRHFDCTMDVS